MSGTTDPRRALLAYAEFLKRSGFLYLEGPQEFASENATPPPSPVPAAAHPGAPARSQFAPPGARPFSPPPTPPPSPAFAHPAAHPSPVSAAAPRPAPPAPARPTATPSPRGPASLPADRAPARAATPTRASIEFPPLAHLALPDPLPREERVARMAAAAARAEACKACPLHATRTQAVYADGDPMARVAFVGEAPGAEEDKRGVPFVGAAGQTLDKMIGAIGFRRDEVYICNTLKCRPPGNRAPAPAEKLACRPFLAEQLELVRPQIIVALGAHAAGILTEGNEGIGKLRSRELRWRGVPVRVTYHPAYLLRNPHMKNEAWEDMLALHRLYSQLNPGDVRKVWSKGGAAGAGGDPGAGSREPS